MSVCLYVCKFLFLFLFLQLDIFVFLCLDDGVTPQAAKAA